MLSRFSKSSNGCLQKSLILYSTSVASEKRIKHPLMVEFLVKSVGFSKQEAISIATKVRVSESSITTRKSELVVDFLKEIGFDGTHIRKVISGFPNALRTNKHRILKPKIRAFEDLGFSGSNLGLIISRHPHILGLSLESAIVPVLGMLKSILGSNGDLVSSMLQIKSRGLFSSETCKSFTANMQLLQSYGLTNDRIKWLILHSSLLFGSTQWAEKLVKRVEEKLGIPRTSEMFVYGIHALTMKSEENIESWIDLFRGYGWSEPEISSLLRLHPLILGLSEENVRLKLKYFMEEIGFGSDYLAMRPAILAFSMDKRILPRVAARQTLMDNDLLKREIGIYSCLLMNESKFRDNFVMPYKETLPQLYEDYIKATGSSVSKTQSAQDSTCL